MRDPAKSMPSLSFSEALTELTIWHCKYRTLQPVSELHALQKLKIATFPDESLSLLDGLQQLECLSILHLPKVTSLAPLGSLKSLRILEIETLPSWDVARKRTVVESLWPLSELPNLQHVSLLGVVPEDGLLDPLKNCPNLKSAKFHGFQKEEQERFFMESDVLKQHAPDFLEFINK